MGVQTGETGIAEADVRALVRLLGETAALPGGHFSKKSFLLDGLSELVGADEWRWAKVAREPRPRILTGLRRVISPGSQWGSAALPAGEETAWIPSVLPVAGMIGSQRELSDGFWGVVALCRNADREGYSERESRLAGLVLEEVPWLHDEGWPTETTGDLSLPPRLREVLGKLLLSKSRKEIAAEVGVAPNTISAYVREIYRRFGVRSHRELLQRFLSQSIRLLMVGFSVVNWGGMK